MSIDKETVVKVARLARIKLAEGEADKYAGELNSILDWIDQLQEVDTDGIEPMTSVVDMELYQRPDEITGGNRAEDVLANAPEEAEGFYVVPKVVE